MLVPGSNLLQLALGVIGQQAVEWRRYAGQETLANGAVRTRWGNPTTIYGSLQPADSRLLQQLGLDWTKNYVVFRGSANFTDVDRDQTGDKLAYGGKTYQIVGKTDWYLQDGWQAVVAVELPTERNVSQVIRPGRIASTSRVPSPRVTTVAPTGQTVRATLITSTARVPAPRVRPGAVGVRPALIASTALVPEPTVTPGAVGVQPTVIPSTARVPEPQVVPGAVGVRPDRIASTSRVPEPTVAVESAWYDAPEFDMWQYVHDANGRRAAAWTGEPKVGGRWPKAEALVAEVTSVIAPAGRGYMAVPGGPYLYDTAADTPRYDAYRGRPQMVIEPLPRFNRLFPSASITAPLTLPMIEYDYLVGLRYGGLRFDGASVGTTGTYTLEAVEPGVWTWGVMPHSALEDVTITPLGEARDVQMDTRTVTGRTPGYPTIPIQTTTERVDQAAEVVQPSAAIVTQLALQGTIMVQGQFYAAPRDGQSRVVMGWDYDGVISIDSDGNAFCTANGGNISVPTGGAGGDPFRVVVSFRERDEAGGFPADRPGITRLSANGSAVAEYEARYGAGLGEHVNMFLARRQNVEDDCGGGAYDLLCYTDELLPAADVQAASAYPDRVPGASPTRAIDPTPIPRLQAVGTRGEIAYSQGNAVTANTRKVTGRTKHFFGPAPVSEFQVGYPNFYVGDWTAGNIIPEIAAPADASVRLYVEMNGVSVQALWNGQPVGTLPAGGHAFCDPMLPAQFGLTQFPAQGQFWLRVEKTAPLNSRHMYHTLTGDPAPPITGEFTAFGQLTATSKIEGTGVMTTAGGWTAFGGYQLPIAIIGRPITPMRAYGIVGASIEHGAGDSNRGDGENGGGYVRRAMWPNKNPFIALQRGSEAAQSFIGNSAMRRPLLQYCNTIICGHGGNDYSYGYSAENTQNRLATIWGLVKAGALPGATVYQVTLSPKTDSTDAWATLANQTPRAGYENGGAWRDAVDAWVASRVAPDVNLDGVLNVRSAQDAPASLGRWRVDLGQPTADGTHPTGPVHIAMGVTLRNLLEAL